MISINDQGSIWIALHVQASASTFFFFLITFLVGSVHCLWDLQTSFFNKIFIKSGSYDTIHTFKNYFVTIFSVFNKINGI